MKPPDIPQNLEAERALLGAILLDNSALGAVEAEITAEDFFLPSHQVTFGIMRKLIRGNGRACDLVILAERMKEEGILERVGGGPYLASLMDGVPTGNPSILKEYCRIVREKAMRRRAMSAGKEIAEELLQPSQVEISEQLSTVAAKLTKIAERAKPAAAEKEKVLYPTLSEAAWHVSAEFYRDAMGESTEASDNYHLACYLTVVGCLLGRSIYIRKGRVTYPNLYTVLIGRSGARKGTAMGLALEFMQDIDPAICVADSIASREGFIKECSAAQRDLEAARTFGPLRMLINYEEFSELMEKMRQEGVRNIGPMLCKLYDCPKEEANKTKNDPAKVTEPTLSILAASSPSYLESLTLKDIRGGFANRILWIPGEPKARKDEPPDPESSILNPLKEKIKDTIQHYRALGQTRLRLSPQGSKLFKHYYHKQYNPPCDDEIMAILAERDNLTCLKVSMIYAALDQVDTEIEEHHIEAGIAFANWISEVRFPIFSEHGFSPVQIAQKKLAEIVESRGEISYSEALRLMTRFGDALLFKRLVDALGVLGGPIEVKLIGFSRQKRILIWRGDD